MHGKAVSLSKRSLHVFIALTFTLSGITPLPPAQAAEVMPVPAYASLRTDFEIPSALGSLQSKFVNEPSSKTVILIQDAHAIPQAQENIRSLIRYFQERYGIKRVALEGASDTLDSRLFKSFPDRSYLEEILAGYRARSEITAGAEAAILGSSDVRFFGVEDWNLYEQGLGFYLAAVSEEENLLKDLETLSHELSAQMEKHYSRSLLDIDRTYRAFERNEAGFLELFNLLVPQRAPPAGSHLELLRQKLDSTGADLDRFLPELRRLTEAAETGFKSLTMTAENRKQFAAFQELKQDFQTSRISPDAYARRLISLAPFELQVSPALHLLADLDRRFDQMKGTELFYELRSYVAQVKEDLFQSPADRDLDRRGRMLDLTGRLIRLELTYDDWSELKQSRENFPAPFTRARLQAHLSFYEVSEKRDEVMFERLMNQLDEPTLLLAGGFHTENLVRRFEEQGVSYFLVSPEIQNIPDENLYREHMRGNVSWKDYFEVQNGRIDIHGAFVRALRDELIRQNPLILKSWRDEIIRDLARDGRVEEAYKYTGVLDEAAGREPEVIPLSAVEVFTDNLRKLESAGQLDARSIARLLSPSNMVEGFIGPAVLQRARLRTQIPLPGMGAYEVSIPAADAGPRAEQRIVPFSQRIGYDPETHAIRTASEILDDEIIPALEVADRFAAIRGSVNADLSALYHVIPGGGAVIQALFERAASDGLSDEALKGLHEILNYRIQNMRQRLGGRLIGEASFDVIPWDSALSLFPDLAESLQAARTNLNRLRPQSEPRRIPLRNEVIRLQVRTPGVFGKEDVWIVPDTEGDYVYFPNLNRSVRLGAGFRQAVHIRSFDETSRQLLYHETSPVITLVKEPGQRELQIYSYGVLKTYDLMPGIPVMDEIAEHVRLVDEHPVPAVDVLNRSELRSDESQAVSYESEKGYISAVGFFPGLGSRGDYQDLGSELYDLGIPEIQNIYNEAALAMNYVDGEGRPDPAKLLFIQSNIPEDADERGAFIGAAFVVHNLALDAYLRHLAEERGTPIKMRAYTGESFGVLTAAIAAGAMSIRDGVKIARFFTPCVTGCAMEDVGEKYHVVGLVGARIEEVAADLHQKFGDAFEVHKYYADGPDQQVNVYVAASRFEEFSDYMEAEHSLVAVSELKPPTNFIAHSRKMQRARDMLDDFLGREAIAFEKPRIPIIANDGSGILVESIDVARGILGIVDRAMYSAQTIWLADKVEADFIIELGLGGKSRALAERNYINTPFIEFTGAIDEKSEQLFNLAGMAYRLRKRLEALHNQTNPDYEMGDDEFRDIQEIIVATLENSFTRQFIYQLVRRMVREEMLEAEMAGKKSAFYRFMEVLQNTYLAHHILKIEALSTRVLILSTIFKRRIQAESDENAAKVDVEIESLTAEGKRSVITFQDYKYPETVTYAFSELLMTSRDLSREARKLIDRHREAAAIYQEAAAELGVDLHYFTDVGSEQGSFFEQKSDAMIAYQYVMYQMMQKTRPAVMGQNYYYVTGVDRVGRLTAIAVSGAMTLANVLRLNQSFFAPDYRQYFNLAEKIEPYVGTPVVDLKSGRHLRAAEDIAAYSNPSFDLDATVSSEAHRHPFGVLSPLLGPNPDWMNDILNAAGLIPKRVIPLNYSSWIVTFDPNKQLVSDEAVANSRMVHITGTNELWHRSLNSELDTLEDLSIFRLTDQNRRVFLFAGGRGTTTANVYPYVDADEKILGFGTGGSESLTIFLRVPGIKGVVVRKILSERLITARWDSSGQGVMMPPFKKAKAQARFLESLPEEAQPYFPQVYKVVDRSVPIPPSQRIYDVNGDGVFNELIYDMSFVGGIEVSEFIRANQPSPEIVARLYEEIFRVLKENIHTHRERKPGQATLESSYFKKIEDRLALSQQTAPVTFSDSLLASSQIIIDGKPYRNIGPLLETFRSHPEYQAVLEPSRHALVMGDTNTENIKIMNIGPILNAMATGVADFTAEDIGLKFLDPRAIGFHEDGQDTGADDPMYDNKPWHNSLDPADAGYPYDVMHGEHFDLVLRTTGEVPDIRVMPHQDHPYLTSYTGIEKYFGQVMTEAWGLDNPDSEFLKQDPYWLIRFAFIMGTHFAAMPPFHFSLETDGTLHDTYLRQKRPLAIYAAGIKWLNLALDMLEGKVTEFNGVKVPPLPYAATGSTGTEETPAPQSASGSPFDNQVFTTLPPDFSKLKPKEEEGGGDRHEMRTAHEHMTNESRLFLSPWVRLVRGMALGQHPTDFDLPRANNIWNTLDALDAKVPASNHYNTLTSRLTRFTLELLAPQIELTPEDRDSHIEGILAALEEINDPRLYVLGVSVTMDTLSKLGIARSYYINENIDLFDSALKRAAQIPSDGAGEKGPYERLTAYGTFFLAAVQAGLKDRLRENENLILSVLDQLDFIPSVFYRGRGASMVFSSLIAGGMEDLIVGGRKDYMRQLLDYFDRSLANPRQARLYPTAFMSTYPIFTILNTIAALGREEYLTYRRNWVTQASRFYNRLSARAKANQAEYYLIALYNLGQLEREIGSASSLTKELIDEYVTGEQRREPQNPLFVNSDDAYIVETAWLFDELSSVPLWLWRRLPNYFREYAPDEARLTNAWGFAYVFTAMEEAGVSSMLFQRSEAYDGKSPANWTIDNFSENGEREASSLPLLNHALLNAALRMRGSSAPNQPAFDTVTFLKEKRAARTPAAETRQEMRTADGATPYFDANDLVRALGIQSAEDLNNETRVFYSPWSRLVRGMGLGQYPRAFNYETADHLNAVWDHLQQTMGIDDTVTRFMSSLNRFILSRVAPETGMLVEAHRLWLDETVQNLSAIEDPFLYADAAAVFFDVLSKFGVPISLVSDEPEQFINAVLGRLNEIKPQEGRKGAYEKIQTIAAVLLSLSNAGFTQQVMQSGLFEQALSELETIDDMFYRGRAAAMIFTVAAVIGAERVVFGARDYAAEMLDYIGSELDRDPGFEKMQRRASYYTFPILTFLNSLVLLGRHEYLSYGRDWVKLAGELMEMLPPDKRSSQSQHYQMLLLNLGTADQVIPDMRAYLQSIMDSYESYQGDRSDEYMRYTYFVEQAIQTGNPDLISSSMIEKLAAGLPVYERGVSAPANEYGSTYLSAAYILSSLDKLGLINLLFKPAEDGTPLLLQRLSNFQQEVDEDAGEFYYSTRLYLYHALIDAALRMRGNGPGYGLGDHYRLLALPTRGNSAAREVIEEELMTKISAEERLRTVEEAVNSRFSETLGPITAPTEVLRGGFQTYNQPFKITTTKGQFIVKRESVRYDKAAIVIEAADTAYRSGLNYVVPMIRDDAGNLIHEIHGHFYSVQPFVDGARTLMPVEADEREWLSSVKTMAELHNALKSVEAGNHNIAPPHDPLAFRFREQYEYFHDQIVARLDAGMMVDLAETYYLELYPEIQKQLDLLEAGIRDTGYNQLPRQLIHGDLRLKNMFFNHDSSLQYLFDFGHAGYAPRIRDFVGVFIYNTGVPFDYERLVEAVAYYNAVTDEPLSDDEIRAIPEVLRGTFLRFIRLFFWESNQFGLVQLMTPMVMLGIRRKIENMLPIFKSFPDAAAREQFLQDVRDSVRSEQRFEQLLSETDEVVAGRAVDHVRSGLRLLEAGEIPLFAGQMDRSIQRLGLTEFSEMMQQISSRIEDEEVRFYLGQLGNIAAEAFRNFQGDLGVSYEFDESDLENLKTALAAILPSGDAQLHLIVSRGLASMRVPGMMTHAVGETVDGLGPAQLAFLTNRAGIPAITQGRRIVHDRLYGLVSAGRGNLAHLDAYHQTLVDISTRTLIALLLGVMDPDAVLLRDSAKAEDVKSRLYRVLLGAGQLSEKDYQMIQIVDGEISVEVSLLYQRLTAELQGKRQILLSA